MADVAKRRDTPHAPLGRAVRLGKSAWRGLVMHWGVGTDTRSLSEQQLDMVASTLSDMRGLAVKAGQWLAEEEDLLPGDFARAFGVSYRDLKPMPETDLDRTFIDELGRFPHQLFTRFEPQPFAAASIGQVHEAHHDAHGRLAVKVQYPRLADTIVSDLRVLRGAMSLVPWARPHRVVLEEVSARFLEELDYEREAANLRVFRERLKKLDVEVPEVVAALSTKRVLSMSYLSGQPIVTWAESAPQRDVDRVASAVLALWITNVVDDRLVHADPSRGNLLVCDGQLQVIDFGCVREISDPISRLMREIFRGDAGTGATVPLYEELGILRGDTAAYRDLLAPLEVWLAAPAQNAGFDFVAEEPWAAQGRDLLAQLIKSGDRLAVHDEFVFLFRAFYALYRLFQRLGAHVSMGF